MQNRHLVIRPMQTFISLSGYDVSSTKMNGGAERDRTADPLLAKQVLSQLSYSPSPSTSTIRSKENMVGPGRLELPTPRLSSVCSNRLSYGPDLRVPTLIEPTGDSQSISRSDHQQGQRPTPVVRRPVRSAAAKPRQREDIS